MYDTIVVGGGISGLYCALSLPNVLVLEESNYWGGRIKTHYHPQYEMGAGRFHKNHKRLWHLIQRFKLNPMPIPGRLDYIDEKDGVVPNVDAYLSAMIQKMTLHDSLRKKTFFQYCVKALGEEDAIQFAYALGFHEIYYKNAYDSLQSLRMDYIQGDYFTLREGLSELCNRMVKEIKGKGHGVCKLNHRVTKIEHVGDHVKVDGYLAKKVIITIPPIHFKNFPILSPYKKVISYLKGPPLLRVYAKYPEPVWFDSMHKMTTSHELRHIIPIHDGIVMIAYVEDTDIAPFLEKGKLKSLKQIGELIETVLSQLFPTLTIPKPLWIRPYLWEIGTHAWLPGNSTKLLETLPVIENIYVCGEAFSTRQSWIEGSLESAEGVLKTLNL